MNILTNALVVFFLCLTSAGAIVLAMMISSNIVLRQNVSRYDCGMAEWHPDIPNQVREKCRNRTTK